MYILFFLNCAVYMYILIFLNCAADGIITMHNVKNKILCTKLHKFKCYQFKIITVMHILQNYKCIQNHFMYHYNKGAL